MSEIQANFNNQIDPTVCKFSFRKVITKDEATGIETETKRPTLELNLALVSVEGVVEIFKTGGKQLDLLMEAVKQVQIDRAREIVNENESITAENFPHDQITWEAISNLPKAERRGGGIDKETWQEFAKDYVTVMPAATGKTVDQVTNAAKILLTRFQTCKTNKTILQLLKDQLAIYTNTSPNAEKYEDCLVFLDNKAKEFLSLDEASFAANL